MRELRKGESVGEAVSSAPLAIVEYGSATCAPCAALHQRIEQWEGEHPGTIALYVPLERHMEEAAQVGVMGAPTVEVWAQGKLALREAGYFSLDLLLQRAERWLG
ncbi:MAG: thioredoxin family protein [Parafannyhessea sp.]|uniref:thioredoxin family protein n=1 Tax=Parafannyhessea sp. TaxID=2847324 RepID=UPI003F117F74